MHIFRHVRTETTALGLCRELDAAAAAADRMGLLLAGARLECALADYWSPSEDDWGAEQQAAGAVAGAAAAWYLDGHPGARPPWPQAGRALAPFLPPEDQRLSAAEPEGTRFYGLSPRGYAAAAQAWQQASGRGQAAWVLGLRTMGSVLAPVVAASLAPTAGGASHRRSTLRPRGAPGDRRLAASARLRAALGAWRGTFLIVDEGPGLSGSSFGGTVRLLVALGIAEARIALLPSWSPDPVRLSSDYAARGWKRWRLYPAPALPAPRSRGGPARDLSAGAWRAALGQHASTPVWGQHERLKYSADGGRTWVKFAGWGASGRRTQMRAQRLARAGWGPPLAAPDLDDGEGCWTRYRRVRAAPLGRHPPPGWCEFAGAYLAWVGTEYALGPPAPPTPELVEMVDINLRRLLGIESDFAAAPPPGTPVALDGRMLREEWGVAAAGFVKFDGTDHGDDPFFPGPADIAWDLAAIAVEFGRDCGAAVAAAYRRRSGARARQLAPRLAWHRLAYSAFRAAYCGFAAAQVDAPDAARFLALATRYRADCSSQAAAWRRRGG